MAVLCQAVARRRRRERRGRGLRATTADAGRRSWPQVAACALTRPRTRDSVPARLTSLLRGLASAPGDILDMAAPDSIRIANAGGYWGDDLSQFHRQVALGPVDYVTLDFLAEITMSIMQKQRARDPDAGYARDFIAQVEGALPLLAERGTRV